MDDWKGVHRADIGARVCIAIAGVGFALLIITAVIVMAPRCGANNVRLVNFEVGGMNFGGCETRTVWR